MFEKFRDTIFTLLHTQINDTNYCFLIDKKIKDGYMNIQRYL